MKFNKFLVACVGIAGLSAIAVVDVATNGDTALLSSVVTAIGFICGWAFGRNQG